MPWCPKCKSEYRQGFTVCADCGSKLVEEEPADVPVSDDRDEWENAQSLQQFTSREIPEAQGDGSIEESGKTAKDGESFDGKEDAKEFNEVVTARSAFGSSSLYQSSSQRADENRSSAWVLLIVGVLGLVVVALGIMEILPLKMTDPYLFYGVMGAIFVLFLVAGIVSMKNAKLFFKKAQSENSLKSTMLDWCRQNLDGQEIDREIDSDVTSEEERYFNRMSYLREKLNHQFMNLDQDFLEQFIDDQVYDMIFNSSNV